MFKQIVFPLLVASLALLTNIYWDNVEIYLNFYRKGEPVKIDSVFGSLIGQTGVTRGGRTIYKFTSIPFAKIPKRFEPPEEFGKWEGTLDATKKTPTCPQMDFLKKEILGQDEDCLFLNIYTPKLKPKKLLPVIFFIFGGHFMYGSTEFYGPEYFLDEDVILVTSNYRTNILGFLNTGDKEATGNQGLKDQVMALKFVQNAIVDFGGSKDLVTIVGNSAGGASVHFHMISNMSKGLFRQAVSQSGTSLCSWAMNKTPKNNAVRFAQIVGCPTQTTSELVACLRKKKVEDLMKVHYEILDIYYDPEVSVFLPTIEHVDKSNDEALSKVFLAESPRSLLKAGKFHHVPWINGVVKDEGCYRSSIITNDPVKMKMLNEDLTTSLANLNMLPKDDIMTLEKIWEEYFPQNETDSGKEVGKKRRIISRDDLRNLTNVISDRWFISCAREAAIYHSDHAPVYLYYFNKKPDLGYGYIASTTRNSMPVKLSLALGYLKFLVYHHIFGWSMDDHDACHTDELQQLFMLTPELSISKSSQHFHFSQQMVKFWTSFVTKGRPDAFMGVDWMENYRNGKQLMYLRLDENPQMIQEPFTSRAEFWETLNVPKN